MRLRILRQSPASIGEVPAWQLLLSLFLPVAFAIGLDLMLATLPLATMSISLICIPLATVLVTRSILAEFDKVN
jgi:hypothetical protein